LVGRLITLVPDATERVARGRGRGGARRDHLRGAQRLTVDGGRAEAPVACRGRAPAAGPRARRARRLGDAHDSRPQTTARRRQALRTDGWMVGTRNLATDERSWDWGADGTDDARARAESRRNILRVPAHGRQPAGAPRRAGLVVRWPRL